MFSFIADNLFFFNFLKFQYFLYFLLSLQIIIFFISFTSFQFSFILINLNFILKFLKFWSYKEIFLPVGYFSSIRSSTRNMKKIFHVMINLLKDIHFTCLWNYFFSLIGSHLFHKKFKKFFFRSFFFNIERSFLITKE